MPVIGDAVYGEGDDTLQSVIAKRLTESGLTLSVAESCTGGFLASLFTAMPGASKYFYGSVTSYDNSVKENILNVSIETIAEHGAVSRECAEAMALGVSRALNTDFAVSTTGIAGPDGGSEDKPVGTVWVGASGKNRSHIPDVQIQQRQIHQHTAFRRQRAQSTQDCALLSTSCMTLNRLPPNIPLISCSR